MNLEQFKSRLNELSNHRKMFENQLSTLAGHIAEITFIINQIENPPVEEAVPPLPVEDECHGEANEQATEQAA